MPKHVTDSERFSIIQPNLDRCYICGATNIHKHEMIPGTANRQKCKDYGLVVALCPRHHSIAHENTELSLYLKCKAQRAFEAEYSHEKFMETFHHDYLGGKDGTR